jgi:hypothetical protein
MVRVCNCSFDRRVVQSLGNLLDAIHLMRAVQWLLCDDSQAQCLR